MKLSRTTIGITALLSLATSAQAAVTWAFDPINSTVDLDASTLADNGANLYGPPNDDSDSASALVYGPGGPNTVEASVNPMSRDAFLPDFTTSASAAALSRLENLDSPSVTFTFNAVNLNDTFSGDGFITSALAVGSSSVRLLFDNFVVPTPIAVDYSWSYDAIANPIHEGGGEDPESCRGTLVLNSSSGMGPGTVFSVLNTGPVTVSDSDTGGWTDTVSPGDYISIGMAMNAETLMESPGTGTFQEDLAGAAFRGTLVLTITTIPEPTSIALIPLIGLGLARRLRR